MDLTGQTLLGKYEIERLLGQGGMGAVWRGRHALTGRKIAIKVLDESLLKNKKIVARFKREARAASKIEHPGIVEVLDIDATEGGVPFMVMEFLEGETLASRIERRGRLEQDELLFLSRLLLEALEAAHQYGVVHRDLKPENIYVVPAGRRGEIVKILDFGISHMREDTGDKLTMTGSVLGTPHYMSPEQAMGDAEVDERADVYAAGVVLYECAVGDVPYDAPNYNRLLRLILDELPKPPRERGAEISEEVERLILWSMEKDRERRVANVHEMREWLERALAGEMPPYEPPRSIAAEARPVGSLPTGLSGQGLARTATEPAQELASVEVDLGLADEPPAEPDPKWGGGLDDSKPPPSSAGVGFDWDLEAALSSPPRLRSSPPPSGVHGLSSAVSGSHALGDLDPLAPDVSDSALELDESALSTQSKSNRPMRPAVGTTSSSGAYAAVRSSSPGVLAAPAVPSSIPPAMDVPPRLAHVSAASLPPPPRTAPEPEEGRPWLRYALIAVVAVAAFAGLVWLVNWVVAPGVSDDAIAGHEPVGVEDPDDGNGPESPREPAWISVRVLGLPPGARLDLDGLPATSPLRVRRGGEHSLRIHAPGYEERRFEFDADRNRTIHARLRPAEGVTVTDP